MTERRHDGAVHDLKDGTFMWKCSCGQKKVDYTSNAAAQQGFLDHRAKKAGR